LLKNSTDHGESSSLLSICFVVSVALLLLVLSAGTCISQEPCQIISVSGITFIEYNPFSPNPATGAGSFKVYCKTAAQGRVLLSAGASGNFSQRLMKRDGGDILLYNLYEDTSCTKIWGDGEQGTHKGDFAFGKDGGEKEFFVYGSIRARQNVAAQSFEDGLTITVEW